MHNIEKQAVIQAAIQQLAKCLNPNNPSGIGTVSICILGTICIVLLQCTCTYLIIVLCALITIVGQSFY